MTAFFNDPFCKLAHEMVVESTDQAFQMMLGGMPKEISTCPIPQDLSSKMFDYLGSIVARGERGLSLHLGLSEAQLKNLGAVMMGSPMEDLEILEGCHQELLNIILGGTMGALSQLCPLKLGVPEMRKSSNLTVDLTLFESQLLSFVSDTVTLEFILLVEK